jgi:hypothetical protein
VFRQRKLVLAFGVNRFLPQMIQENPTDEEHAAQCGLCPLS